MTAIVVGSAAVGAPEGDVDVFNDPILSFAGASNVDSAVGAFTTRDGLPEMNLAADWDAFAAAMLAKTTSTYDGGITVTGYGANRFVGAGGAGNDQFEVHTAAGARIDGRGGHDSLSVSGVFVDDTLNGGEGDDRLSAASGDDIMDGGDGDDTLIGGEGDDTMAGGAGIDTVDYLGAGYGVTVSLAATGPQLVSANLGSQVLTGIENLVGHSGADSLTGGDGANRLEGAGGPDTLDGGAGDDTLVGGSGKNSLIGGAGFDWISYADTPDNMTVLLYSDTILRLHSLASNFDHATGIEGIIGSGFGDDLAGHIGRNAILGGAGDDLVRGLEEADTLNGGDGTDYVEGD